MIAPARLSQRTLTKSVNHHDQFLSMMPQIRIQSAIAFREFDAEACEDAIEEVVASCYVAFVRLVEQHRSELAYATPLAQYAIKQFHDGRRVGFAAQRTGLSVEYTPKG